MTTLFTEIDLVRYLYGESNETQKTQIENVAVLDAETYEELANLEYLRCQLDSFLIEPSEKVIKKIVDNSSQWDAELT